MGLYQATCSGQSARNQPLEDISGLIWIGLAEREGFELIG